MGRMSDDAEPTSPDAQPGRTPLPERLLSDKAMALLPGIISGSPIAPIEVLVQEGITVLSFPVARIDDLAHVRGMYASRAEFGVHGIGSVDQLSAAIDAGARVLSLRHPDADLVAMARDHGVAVLAPALTPTEVQNAWSLGVSAVLVTPADAFGGQYAEQLAALAPEATIVPSGGVGAYSGGRWLEAGAPAVCLDDALIGDGFEGGPLGSLRERAQTFRDAVERH